MVGGVRRKLQVLQRALALGTAWAAAAYFAALAAGAATAHHKLDREVRDLRARAADEFASYSNELARGERISKDKDYQAGLLKENYGYTKPDETPVIIIHQED